MQSKNLKRSGTYISKNIFSVFSLLALIGCGGGGGSGTSGGGETPTTPTTPTYSVSSTFIKGLVTGATCELFELTAAGAKSDLVTSGNTTNGVVSFGSDIEYQGSAVIECIGGSYTDEATGATLTAPLMRAVVDLDGNGSFVVSPLTEIAAQLAETGGDLGMALTTHNSGVASALGLDADITELVPLDLNNIAAVNTASGRYGTVLALISQLNANDASGSLSDVLDELAGDLEDSSLSVATLTDLSEAVSDLSTSTVAENISDTALANVVASAGIPIEDDNPVAETGQPNILVILSDDQGVDSSAEYDYSMDPPNTPVLSALAADGVVFQNAWATPACSSTRAGLLTGKHGINNGVPTVPGNLDENDEIIYEYLGENTATSNYASAYIGKWHLGTDLIDGDTNPVGNGIPYFAGALQGNISDYDSWNLTIDSSDTAISESVSTEYNTSELTRLAENWIADQDSPWFLTLAYNAPHGPVHLPNSSLHSRDNLTNCNDSRECFLAMIEAMDTEIGNLLNTLSAAELENTLIIYIGDNGTANGQRDPLVFNGGQVKNSLFDGGMRVPLFASGAGVTRSDAVEERLVTVTDLYATIAELAGAEIEEPLHDSISLAGYLSSTNGDTRQHAYTDWENGEWAIRNQSHHLINEDTQTLYRLDDTGISHTHVQVTDDDILFELQVEALKIQGGLNSFNATPDGLAILDISQDGDNAALGTRASTCARFVKNYEATANNIGGDIDSNRTGPAPRYTPSVMNSEVSISVEDGFCIIESNAIPNHDAQYETTGFASDITPQTNFFHKIPATPEFADEITPTRLAASQAILLNGVTMDVYAAGCLGIQDGVVGCGVNEFSNNPDNEWRFDPGWENSFFNEDAHGAHTQGAGEYHYHGNPRALYDLTGNTESGVIGFAADGFPLYGPFINDQGTVREVTTSYQLKSGSRPNLEHLNALDADDNSAQILEYSEQQYDGAFRQDYEYVEGLGDLDECNGMFKDGSYGYYVTDSFPYTANCYRGERQSDFSYDPNTGGNAKTSPEEEEYWMHAH